MNLERRLQSIGKRCFRNCYEVAQNKGENLTIEDLLAHDPELIGTKKTGLRTRLSGIKCIFRENLQERAMGMAQQGIR